MLSILVTFLPALALALVMPDESMFEVLRHFEPRQTSSIPSYALDYGTISLSCAARICSANNTIPAPLVHLYPAETYFPSDIGAQLPNTQPEIEYTPVTPSSNPLTLDNLNSSLSAYPGSELFLTSITNVTTDPSWLHGVKPDASGASTGAVSCAIIVNDHSSDTSGFVDVFYMYFYAFNYGTFLTLLNQTIDISSYPIGNHIGDWEHNMIRFNKNGTPQSVWYSQHDNGEAFTYDCLEKSGIRPIVYSANGSHANYAIAGTHAHGLPDLDLPVGPVTDNTGVSVLSYPDPAPAIHHPN